MIACILFPAIDNGEKLCIRVCFNFFFFFVFHAKSGTQISIVIDRMLSVSAGTLYKKLSDFVSFCYAWFVCIHRRIFRGGGGQPPL